MAGEDWPPAIHAALADDAQTLALLHDREPTAEMLRDLRAIGFPANLTLLPLGARAQAAWQAMGAALAALPEAIDAAELDRLAADFAAIHFTAAYRAPPCESAWIDEDGLLCAQAMFDWRALLRQAGLAAADWRRRPDDHLVLQLGYLAHALRRAETGADWQAIADVLDTHLLRWLPEFCARIAQRCATPFHAGLAQLTAAWIEELRALIGRRLAGGE